MTKNIEDKVLYNSLDDDDDSMESGSGVESDQESDQATPQTQTSEDVIQQNTESKYVRMMFYIGEINKDINLPESKFYTLQHFNYYFSRMLGEKSEVLNATSDAVMNLSIKIDNDVSLKELYNTFMMDKLCTFSIVTNALFNMIDQYQNEHNIIMVVQGYILELNESFSRTTENNERDITTLKLSVVMREMKYKYGDDEKSIRF